MNMKKDVVIVGAGLAGLSLANGLEESGVSYLVVEKQHGPSASGAGILIHPSGTAALQRLGVQFPGECNAWCELTKMHFGSPRNNSIVNVPIGEVERPVVSLNRQGLYDLLLSKIPTENRLFGCEVAKLTSVASGQSRISLNNGTNIDTALVVIASGANTSSRTDLDQPRLINQSRQMVWRWIVDAALPMHSGHELHDGRWRLGVFPISERQSYVFLVASRMTLSEAKNMTPEQVMAQVGSFGPMGKKVANSNLSGTELLLHAIFQGPLKWEGNNEVVFIGDAAHPMTPDLGIGGSLAFEDSATLVSAIRREGLNRAAIVRSLAKRTRRVKALMRQSSMYGILAHIPGPLLTDLKLHSLRLAPDALIKHSQRRLYAGFYKAIEKA